ncbi:MAG: 5-bromo-4-chloroindolyl phosphate hydrolysis family protein [Lachnospiraceae bacterium]|nr:5-bromo-4-chloroindolyl phosphate hydrolysis family protein [Lachnospiraceae bacterium]
MSNFDWEKFGSDISKNVQNAIDSQDFHQLSNTINKTVADAMGTVSDGVRQAHKTAKTQTELFQERRKKEREVQRQNLSVVNQNKMMKRPFLFAKLSAAKVGGMLMSIFGFSGVAIFSIIGLIFFATGLAIPTLIFSGLTALSLLMGIGGVKKLGLAARFGRIVKALGNKEYMELQQISEMFQKPLRFVQKDVNRMIAKGWFRQGRLDTQKTSLMVSDTVYHDYQKMRLQIEEKRIHDEAEAMRRDVSNLDTQVQEVVKAGDAYIDKIRKCNAAIPGIEISEKISRIEMLLERIFSRVREEPNTASDTRRLMDYYLPTTVKLLEAYQQLDSQPIKGGNILTSKKEIEDTLDTLNLAFEKMLNGMFQDKALDLSADISVLNTMLAQEGLTKEDFK